MYFQQWFFLKKLLKICFPVLLLGIVLYQTVGYVVTYHLSKEYFEEEAVRANSKGALEKLAVLSSSAGHELIQVESSEIMYKGRLFDYSRKELRGDSIIYYGRYDSNEERWLQQDENQHASIQAMSLKKNLQLEFLSLYCASAAKHLELQLNDITAGKLKAPVNSICNYDTISDIPVPPPQA